MELKEIREVINQAIETFVDALGLDGEYYASLNCTPMAYGKLGSIDGKIISGRYLNPQSKELNEILEQQSWRETTKEIIKKDGLVFINEIYKKEELNNEILITFVHETLHANRNVLLLDYLNNERNVDPSQDVLHGEIDNSYTNFKEKSEKMKKQKIIDEALIELMSILSVLLNNRKNRGKSIDIWEALEILRTNEKDDIKQMCELILKHHDLDLFKWQLDPITYTQGNIDYDFFEHYIKPDDAEIVDKIYELSPHANDIGIEIVNENNNEEKNEAKNKNNIMDIFKYLRDDEEEIK